MSVTYVVKTNLPPEMVTQVGLEIFAHWVSFALGQATLGGKRLVYPTGRYAASIQFKQEGESVVSINADGIEAEVIEHGHQAVDLKMKLQHGRAYPMHRRVGGTAGTTLRRIGSTPASRKPEMWAELKGSTGSGFASIGPNSPADSWIIPAMPAYSPAMILAAQAQKAARDG